MPNLENKMLAVAVATALCATLASCASGGGDALSVTQGTVLRNVTVVNTRDGSLAPHMAVVIDGGKIQRVLADASVRASGAAQSVDASGKYVVPGFNDMHTHTLPMADARPAPWPVLIANGVTGIREMAGSAELIQRARKLNADSAAGRIDAPEVLQVPGDIIAGVGAPPVAVGMVRQQKAMGADFIKVVAAGREATLALLGEAKAQGLDVAGHLPITINSIDASQAGWKAMEHLGAGLGALLDCANDEPTIRRALLSGQGAKPPFPPTFVMSPMLYRAADAPFYRSALASYNEDKCVVIAKTFAANGTWQVPTLIRLRTMDVASDPLYRNDPNLRYVDKTTRALWAELGQQFATNVPAAAAAAFSDYYIAQQKFTKLLKRNGVKMLAGSDLGGIWIIPGVSLHQEFRELAASGLSPLEILQMSTLNAAEFLRREATMGSVDPGKNADLVLLDANPIDSVANLAKISGVVLKGKYLPKGVLEKMKADAADAYSAQPLRSLSSALDPHHID